MLNPNLNIAQISQIYRQQQALAIPNAFDPQLAQQLHDALSQLDWQLEINDYNPGERLRIPMAKLRNPDGYLLGALDEVEHSLDRNKLFYVRLNVESPNFEDPTLLHLKKLMNSDAFLAPMREITGQPQVSHCWMEATCYQSCCFLGGHRDDHNVKNRVAFVLNLTQQWQMDWGGLLMLVNNDMQPTMVPPLWNSLALFTVPRDHFVTTISPAALGKRYSITGWLRDGNPE